MTSDNVKYLIDTNIFIQSKNLCYPFNFAPGFWDWLEQINGKDSVISIAPVYAETQNFKDELATWCKLHKKLFASLDVKVYQEIATIKSILDSRKIEQSKINQFMSGIADPYLIAYAKVHDYVVLTHEINPVNDSLCANKKIQIPPVCKLMGVKCITLYQLLKTVQTHKLILQ